MQAMHVYHPQSPDHQKPPLPPLSLQAVQPVGPYLLLGASVAGAALAHAMACQLEAAGERAALLLLDGCVGAPGVSLHDPTWYALFYLLRELGTFGGSMGEFVDYMRGASSPPQQLKRLNHFRPAAEAGVSEEQWDAAVSCLVPGVGLLPAACCWCCHSWPAWWKTRMLSSAAGED